MDLGGHETVAPWWVFRDGQVPDIKAVCGEGLVISSRCWAERAGEDVLRAHCCAVLSLRPARLCGSVKTDGELNE